MNIRKIVILGPESTGKSTLCEQLAGYYHTHWCREYAREYLLKHGTNYSYDDLLTIAKGQLALEDEATKRVITESKFTTDDSRLLFIDTDMYVMKVWCEFVFGKCHPWILNQVVERKYDLYLLCNTDLPWTKDELREYPDLIIRKKLFHIYKDILVNQSTPWAEISGTNEERLQHALTVVNRMFAE